MSPSEIALLAVGLVIGAAVGAAIMEALRARPAQRHTVRVTISPNSVHARRPATLADAGASGGGGPLKGSPLDGAWGDHPLAPAGMPAASAAPVPSPPLPDRTRVPSGPVTVSASAVGFPVDRAGSTSPTASPAASGGSAVRPGAVALLDPVAPAVSPPAPAPSPLPSALDVGEPVTGVAVRPRPPAPEPRPSLGVAAVAVTATSAAERSSASAGEPDAGAREPTATPGDASTAPCESARRLVDERCAFATAAREHARVAAEALRDGQRAYDDLRRLLDEAQAAADPRALAASKDELHRRFREASEAAPGADEAELAAREWLTAVNDLNARTREAARFLEAGGEELRAAIPRLERLAVEADAARISAEGAAAGCQEARERLAACEEEAAAASTPAAAVVDEPEEPHPFDALWPGETESTVTQPPVALPTDAPPSDQPLVLRMLRGDRGARDRLVAALAGDDAEAVRIWQLQLAAFTDAINARAIEDGYLDLPGDDPFWKLFEARERREIVGALSALGYRFDGLRGFADDRVPAARDLSLAVGYAGLDRMRIRAWPHDEGLATLYDRATVAADEWLVDQADDLSLGRMVDALGPRAGDLTDVWNAWGRIRPVLLSST